jgi:hypothetical protein
VVGFWIELWYSLKRVVPDNCPDRLEEPDCRPELEPEDPGEVGLAKEGERGTVDRVIEKNLKENRKY